MFHCFLAPFASNDCQHGLFLESNQGPQHLGQGLTGQYLKKYGTGKFATEPPVTLTLRSNEAIVYFEVSVYRAQHLFHSCFSTGLEIIFIYSNMGPWIIINGVSYTGPMFIFPSFPEFCTGPKIIFLIFPQARIFYYSF